MSHYGQVIAEIEMREAARKVEAQKAADAAAAKNHRAWLRLCGMMDPIGRLQD